MHSNHSHCSLLMMIVRKSFDEHADDDEEDDDDGDDGVDNDEDDNGLVKTSSCIQPLQLDHFNLDSGYHHDHHRNHDDVRK